MNIFCSSDPDCFCLFDRMTKYFTDLIILLNDYSSRSSSNRHRHQLRSPSRWAVRATRCFGSPMKMHPERYEEMTVARWARRVDASLSRRPFHRLPAPRSWAHWLWRPKPRRRRWVNVFSFHHVPSILHYFNALIKWIFFVLPILTVFVCSIVWLNTWLI